MNKLAIPAILGAIVLLGGAFSLSEVQNANAVHTSIQTAVGTLQTVVFTDTVWANATGEDEIRLTCTGSTVLYGIAYDQVGTLAAGDNVGINIDPDGTDTDFSEIALTVDEFGTNAPSKVANLLAGQGPYGLDTNGTVEVEAVAGFSTGDEEVNIAFTASSTGTCTAAAG